jgi:polysaccharide export outer membrane protein
MEIQEIVKERLSSYIKDPNVTITVREIQSKKVYVLGEVNRPGSYQIVQPTTVLQLLTEAGGLRPYAKEKAIYVLRTGNGQQQKFSFNYRDVVEGKKLEQNILVQPNDTIVVP